MLPEKVDADVHKFRRIQRASAVLRHARGVGRPALEVKIQLEDRQGLSCKSPGGISRVPGERGIQTVKHTVPGHKGLSVPAFLRRAAKELYGTGKPALFHEILDSDSPGDGSGSQCVMGAAMAVPLFHQILLLRQSRHLA